MTQQAQSQQLEPRQHPVHRNEARPAVAEHLHTKLRTENRPNLKKNARKDFQLDVKGEASL